ncbi:hypothetical protein CN383_00155 [Priestia megaterium]|uniref:hypothetical protein n=1 Tax=Priestia megaterium TaxID=1404 RepID=UPI000BF6B2D3|nr:hypothetical protein [Priestia megaterium]PFB07266.1 hypothetical protein CN383_00155 [Priestia megaterium]
MSTFQGEFQERIQKRYQRKLKEKLALDAKQEQIREEVFKLNESVAEYVVNGIINIDTTIYNGGEFSVIEMGDDKLVFQREDGHIVVLLNDASMDYLTFNGLEVVSKHLDGNRFSLGMVEQYIKEAFRTTLGFK